MADRDRPLYAVLIDADNIPATYAAGILKEVTGFAEPALRKVYGDWTSKSLTNWKGEVRRHGLVAYQETANTTGKNASDIGLVIDAMDILHGGRLDGFVLVSSDSDFTRLASRIREHGLDVIGMGMRKAPISFVNACQRFIYLDNLDSEEPEVEKPKEAATKSQPKKAKEPEDPAVLITRAMEKIDPDGEWFTLGQLGQFIIRDKPDFDPRNYGEKKLSALVKKLARFESRQDGTHLQVRRLD